MLLLSYGELPMQECVTTAPEDLSPQQQLQQLLLAVCFEAHGTDVADGMDMDVESSCEPLLELSHRLWVLVRGEGIGREQASPTSRFAAHFGLALVALGVVPSDFGVCHHVVPPLVTAKQQTTICSW
jgi:hypothetical protein